jgi:hypothetical protein
MNAHALPRALRDSPRQVTPWQAVACAVLRQAVTDAQHHPNVWGRDLAAAWLRGSEGFLFWCAVAGIDPDIIERRVR